MRIDVWSDIVCPFCHLGRRHLELALAQFEHRDEVGVIWHSFELDRNAEAVQAGSVLEKVAAKYGAPIEQMRAQHEEMAAAAAAVGLDFQWERLVGSNSYAAHRLLHYARSVGRESEVTDRIMRAWYSEGQAIGDPAVLQRLAVDAGWMRPRSPTCSPPTTSASRSAPTRRSRPRSASPEFRPSSSTRSTP
jgi:predicted DsbA family dithiol-disulfide isomerase